MRTVVILVLCLTTGAFGRHCEFSQEKTTSQEKNPFSLEEVLYTSLGSFRADWVADGVIQYMNTTTGNIMFYDMKSEKVAVEASVIKKFDFKWYKFSSDNTYLLLKYDIKEVYRHSSVAKYMIYSLLNKEYFDVANKAHLQSAEWVPGHTAVVYIKDNDIYSLDIKNKAENRITNTGIAGKIYNGVSDWVYEEEILGMGTTVNIAPDGSQMVFLTIDDTEVVDMKFMTYGEPGNLTDQYTKQVTIPYPKPGTPLSKYKLWHYDFTDKSSRAIAKFQKGREIIYGWKWVSENQLAVTYTNRAQNVSQTDLCNIKEGSCRMVYQDRNCKGWANFDVPLFSKNGDKFLVLKRVPVGGDHYYHVLLQNERGSRLLTNGTFMVKEILKWDESTGTVYYKASELDQPSTSHVFAVSEMGDDKPVCLTCQLKSTEGTSCKMGTLNFNKMFKYVIASCQGPTPRDVAVYELSPKHQLKEIRVLDTSAKIRKFMEKKLQPKQMNLRVKVTDTIEAEVRLLLPPNMDTTGKTKYPLLIYVYGGPDNPQVTDAFKFDWSLYLTTNRSVIYGMIDGRGTGRKGTEMMYAVYKNLGTVEIQDQITVTKYLQDNLQFIDKKRTGIWGWSYGGYATLKALEYDVNDVFRCGASVAPVTDWIYYNAVYTERYMDSPLRNPKGYHRASALYDVENLRNKEFLLMHGTGDDNVHYQHAMHIAKALQRKNIVFTQEAYPDEAHSISGVKSHVYYMLDRFWKECFKTG